MKRLTPTSFAMLGLLAIKPWSTYELTKLFGRSVQYVMPRTEANRYLEAKRLIEAGLVTASESRVGKRRRTIYTITPAGRSSLVDWLRDPPRPTHLESESLLKILFGDMADLPTLLDQIRAFEAEAEEVEAPWRAIAREYADGTGPFPERVHINTLFWVLLDRWAQLRSDWAAWAIREVDTWPDEHGPRDRDVSRALLKAFLDGEWGSTFPGASPAAGPRRVDEGGSLSGG